MSSGKNSPSNELERLEKEALLSKKSKSRDEKVAKEVRELVEHLQSKTEKEMRETVDQLKGSIKLEMEAAVDGLWKKIEPWLSGQERMSNSLMDAFEEYVQNVNFAFGSGGESPNHGNAQIEPMGENEQNVPPVEQQEHAPAPGNGNEKGALQQGQMRGQFRGGWRGRMKNRGTVRGGGRPWNGTAAFCHCVECRRPKGWHGRGGGRGGAGPSGFGHGGRGGRGSFGNGQHMGHMRR